MDKKGMRLRVAVTLSLDNFAASMMPCAVQLSITVAVFLAHRIVLLLPQLEV